MGTVRFRVEDHTLNLRCRRIRRGEICGGFSFSNIVVRSRMIPPSEAQREAERQRPSRPVLMHQRWEQLLFLHWAWDPAEVQRTLPRGLTVDPFDGRAWLGVVPFFMRDVRPAWFPSLP